MKRTRKVRAKKVKRFKVPKVRLRNVPVQIRPQLNRNDENDPLVLEIRQTAQNLQPMAAPQVIPPLNHDLQEAFIRSLQEAARNLQPVGYRVENGVIIID